MLSTFALDTQVIKPELCTGCGACQGLCPYWGSHEGRTFCYFDCERTDGRCQSFCPRMETDLSALKASFFPAETLTPEIGPYLRLYLTRAADASLRDNAQHGGTMTALVELALQEGFIDAAVLTKSNGGLEAEGVLAKTPEEIRACSGSTFQIPPTLAVLNKALKENTYQKIGVVGTPCKTLATYKMMAKPLADHDNNADNIGFVFGLFCGWGLDWNALCDLTAKYADPSKVRHMDIPPSKYHSMVLTEKGKDISIDLDEVNPIVRAACRACTDMTAEFSDISVGGARSADGWDVDKGWNQVIVRTEKGARLLKLAQEKGILEFKELPETALDKIKAASLGKKRNGVKYMQQLTGDKDDLGYLNPNADFFRSL